MRWTFVLAVLLSSAQGGVAATPQTLAWTRAELQPPGAAVALAEVSPALTVNPRGGYLLTWQVRLEDGCAALRMATVDARGRLGTPSQIAQGCDWFVNWADFPALAVADNGDWVVHWLRKSAPDTYAYDIHTARSTNQGRSWSAPQVLHDDGTHTEHGFVAMAADGADRLRVLWLDGRHTGGSGDHSHHDHAAEGPMSLRSAVLGRRGKVAGSDVELDRLVCSCCNTALVRLARGQGHLALYRNRTADEIRDIHLRHHDGQQWFGDQTLQVDGWQIKGCPVNGPALAADPHGGAWAAWTTMADGADLRVRLRHWRADAQAAAPYVELEAGPGVLGRVSLAPIPGREDRVAAVWLGAGPDAHTGSLRLAILDRSLNLRSTHTLASLPAGRDIGLPRIASSRRSSLIVWTELDPATATAVKTGKPATRLAAAVVRW